MGMEEKKQLSRPMDYEEVQKSKEKHEKMEASGVKIRIESRFFPEQKAEAIKEVLFSEKWTPEEKTWALQQCLRFADLGYLPGIGYNPEHAAEARSESGRQVMKLTLEVIKEATQKNLIDSSEEVPGFGTNRSVTIAEWCEEMTHALGEKQ
jgi:hypothetical protein